MRKKFFIFFTFFICFSQNNVFASKIAECPKVNAKNFESDGRISNILKFAVISDLHFGAPTVTSEIGSGLKDMIQAQGITVNGLHGIVMTGDLTGDNHNGGRPNQLSSFQNVWEKTMYPVYLGLGNHDSTGIDTKTGEKMNVITAHPQMNAIRMKQYLFDRMNPRCSNSNTANIDASTMPCLDEKVDINDPVKFDFQIGLLCKGKMMNIQVEHATDDSVNYSWNWGPIHLIQLNSVFNSSYYFTKGGSQWLEKDLSKYANDGRPVILFQHYGYDSFSTKGWWSDSDRERLDTIISEYNILGIFTGHAHHPPTYIPVTGKNGKSYDTFSVPPGGIDNYGGYFYVNLDLTQKLMNAVGIRFTIDKNGVIDRSYSLDTIIYSKKIKIPTSISLNLDGSMTQSFAYTAMQNSTGECVYQPVFGSQTANTQYICSMANANSLNHSNIQSDSRIDAQTGVVTNTTGSPVGDYLVTCFQYQYLPPNNAIVGNFLNSTLTLNTCQASTALSGAPPSPQTSTPSPQTSTPSPQTSTPSPQTSTPSPQTSTPSPQTSTPSPQTSTPSPQTSTPSPQTSTPSPQTSTPSRVITAPDILNTNANSNTKTIIFK